MNMFSQAILDLEFTPLTPSLLPIESHLNIYLNDEIMGVIPLKKKDLGHKTTLHYRSIHGLFKILIILKFTFIGHYREICENQANTTLWLDISKNSQLHLTYQSLKLSNELANFPRAFL